MVLKLGSGPGTSVKGNRSKKCTEKGKETGSGQKRFGGWKEGEGIKGTGENWRVFGEKLAEKETAGHVEEGEERQTQGKGGEVTGKKQWHLYLWEEAANRTVLCDVVLNTNNACGSSRWHWTWRVSGRAAPLLSAGSNLTPLAFSLAPSFPRVWQGALNSDSRQRVKAQVPSLTESRDPDTPWLYELRPKEGPLLAWAPGAGFPGIKLERGLVRESWESRPKAFLNWTHSVYFFLKITSQERGNPLANMNSKLFEWGRTHTYMQICAGKRVREIGKQIIKKDQNKGEIEIPSGWAELCLGICRAVAHPALPRQETNK